MNTYTSKALETCSLESRIDNMMMISLFDFTGVMGRPWIEAGYKVLRIDLQNKPGLHESQEGWTYGGDVYDFFEIWEGLDLPREEVRFLAAFPPCTDLTAAGARWWKAKAAKDPLFQEKALALVSWSRLIADFFGCPYLIENPQGRISKMWRKPDHVFNPWMFTGYAPEDNYNKRTHLWCGNGFTMPEPFQDSTLGPPAEVITSAWSGKDRKNQRSKTPRGFARAVYTYNNKEMR
jgi:hypothetical protein